MLGRGRLEAAVLAALARAGAALDEQRALADGGIALAAEALAREELPALQRRIEEVGAAVHRAFAWAFAEAGADPAPRIAAMVARLDAAGFESSADPFGAAVSLSALGKRPKAGACSAAERIAQLGAALGSDGPYAIILLAGDARPGAAKGAGCSAEDAAAALAGTGVDGARISTVALDGAHPLPALGGWSARCGVVAALVVPLPGPR
jgi:hypothetical protein